MTTTLQRRIAGATLAAVAIIAAYFAVAILSNLLGMAIAHADTGPPAAPGVNWTAIAAWAGFALGALSALLHYIAPRTKATWDDKLRDDVDALWAAVRSAPPDPTGPVPAVKDGAS